MAAPTNTPVTSNVPAGIPLKEGALKCVVVFNRLPTFSVWALTVKPGGFDNGTPIRTSTQLNTSFHTKRGQELNDSMETTLTGTYDPNAIASAQVQVLLGRKGEGSISQYWPDGSGKDFYGYVGKIDFGVLEIGKLPEITLTVVETDWDPVNNLEVGPVYTNVSGT